MSDLAAVQYSLWRGSHACNAVDNVINHAQGLVSPVHRPHQLQEVSPMLMLSGHAEVCNGDSTPL